jgi:hypothetical protein
MQVDNIEGAEESKARQIGFAIICDENLATTSEEQEGRKRIAVGESRREHSSAA